jgi:hypothetical protein
MSVILWLLRALVILLVIRLVVSFIRGTLVTSRQRVVRRGQAGSPERIGGRLVQDPQCGTYIPEERAITYGRGDRAQHFCSEQCRDTWIAQGAGRRSASE